MAEDIQIAAEEKLFGLAERAYDLWGRILDAQIEYVSEYPFEINPKDTTLRLRDEQIGIAGHLFDAAIRNANSAAQDSARAAEAAEAADKGELLAAPPRRPRPQKPVKTFRATRRSQEEIKDFTDLILGAARNHLDNIHADYNPRQSEEAKKRQFLAGETIVHARKGGSQVKQAVRNRRIAEQEDLSQVVLWTAQANGPRQAPFLQTPEDRISFVTEMLNMVRLDTRQQLGSEVVWKLRDEAVDEGLLQDIDDPKVTPKGLELVGQIAERQHDKVSPRF